MIVNIVGNIGVGKTSLLHELEKCNKNYHIIYEPVDEWVKSGMLCEFYDNIKKNSEPFQYYVKVNRFLDRIKKIKQIQESSKEDFPIIICERSWYEDNVFLESLFQQYMISGYAYDAIIEFDKLIDFYLDTYINKKFKTIDIYLDCKTTELMERIIKRDREEEMKISKYYLDKLSVIYDQKYPFDKVSYISTDKKPIELIKKEADIIIENEYKKLTAKASQ